MFWISLKQILSSERKHFLLLLLLLLLSLLLLFLVVVLFLHLFIVSVDIMIDTIPHSFSNSFALFCSVADLLETPPVCKQFCLCKHLYVRHQFYNFFGGLEGSGGEKYRKGALARSGLDKARQVFCFIACCRNNKTVS